MSSTPVAIREHAVAPFGMYSVSVVFAASAEYLFPKNVLKLAS
jgi:hypothetical protein